MDKIKKAFFLLLFLIFLNNFAYPAFQLGKNGPRIGGFFEAAFGYKFGQDQTKRDDFNLAEQRLQLETAIYPNQPQFLYDWRAAINFRGDFIVDEYFGGKTDFELRQLNLVATPFQDIDIKLGRQVLTWGTGDLVFLNDLFPKDYISFYIGRDVEYLKRPSDAVKISYYQDLFNLDFVIIPDFEPNKLPTGDRLSFFDSLEGGIAGVNSDRFLKEPANQPKNSEFALRLYRNIDSYEVALYGFRGFYKSPRGFLDEAAHKLFYPRLDAYGASIRGPAAGGIANFEFAYYNSRQDSNGDNRLIENSTTKYLIGYKKDLGSDLTLGGQYLFKQILNYDNYKRALRPDDFRGDKNHHLLTFRITKLFKNQTVKVNLFTFYSPSDQDFYLRPSLAYDLTDSFKLTFGANLIWGRDDHTEFGQFEHNKNLYLRARYSF
ncbi:MAG: hypothetical protein R6U54_00795 [Candidatus Omnitrophota bacterium]